MTGQPAAWRPPAVPPIDPVLGTEWNPGRLLHPAARDLAAEHGDGLLNPMLRSNLTNAARYVRDGRWPDAPLYTGHDAGGDLAVCVTCRAHPDGRPRPRDPRDAPPDVDADDTYDVDDHLIYDGDLVHVVDLEPHILVAGSGSHPAAHDLALSLACDVLPSTLWGDAIAVHLAPAITWSLVAALPDVDFWQIDYADVAAAILAAAGEPADHGHAADRRVRNRLQRPA